MRLLRRSSASIALFWICIAPSFALPANAASNKAAPTMETGAILHALCGERVALLGESPLHGFGKTLDFKTGLVRHLIDDCHYNAFFIESGIYDFLNIEKKLKSGQEVTEPMLAAAIGGLWAAREVRPLIPFLLEKAKARSLILAGIDDQLARGTYAQREMPADLVQHLPGDEKPRCLSILQRHTLWQYTRVTCGLYWLPDRGKSKAAPPPRERPGGSPGLFYSA